MIGFPSLRGVFTGPRVTITRIATYFYAIASSAGFLFFGLNFGEEAGAATEIWITRACIVQGLQQIWVSALWFWGYTLNGTDPKTYVTPRAIMYVVWPMAVISLAFAYLLFFGLPDYYRQVSRETSVRCRKLNVRSHLTYPTSSRRWRDESWSSGS